MIYSYKWHGPNLRCIKCYLIYCVHDLLRNKLKGQLKCFENASVDVNIGIVIDLMMGSTEVLH